MLPPILRAPDHCSALVRRLHQCRQRGELLDCSIRVDTVDGDTKHILVHKIIIHCSSNILKDLPCDVVKKVGLQEVNLNLKSNDEVNCLEALISFMYTGSLETANCELNILKRLAMLYGIHGVLNLMQSPEQDTLSVTHSSDLHAPTVTSPAAVKEWTQRVVQNMQWTYGNLLFPNSRMFSHVSTLEVVDKNPRRNQHTFDSASQLQTFIDEPAATCTAEQIELWHRPIRRAVSNDSREQKSEVIIPSSEREGWCRNKKYIERVPSGYMCTVCQKVYGRYNSVSYHVTIYHRNPPIRCDEEGCKFSTREARYIHFHKFYRHRIPLPENIDLGKLLMVIKKLDFEISKSHSKSTYIKESRNAGEAHKPPPAMLHQNWPKLPVPAVQEANKLTARNAGSYNGAHGTRRAELPLRTLQISVRVLSNLRAPFSALRVFNLWTSGNIFQRTNRAVTPAACTLQTHFRYVLKKIHVYSLPVRFYGFGQSCRTLQKNAPAAPASIKVIKDILLVKSWSLEQLLWYVGGGYCDIHPKDCKNGLLPYLKDRFRSTDLEEGNVK
uniref:BTB domain-containing protein n=1 Tax=Wuchereria bancrofti TaxID=6293 RepID=A0A1I8EPM1_WUCBA